MHLTSAIRREKLAKLLTAEGYDTFEELACNHRMGAFCPLQTVPDATFAQRNVKKAAVEQEAWIGTHSGGEAPLTQCARRPYRSDVSIFIRVGLILAREDCARFIVSLTKSIRRIRGEEEPIVARAQSATQALVGVTAEAINLLHWADFETLVDLVFARSGWCRTSPVGSTQETIDLILEHPTTGERAMVQVKSRADQRMLKSYISEFKKAGIYDRLFFVCHSPATRLTVGERTSVHLWVGAEFARTIVKLGLQDWVFQKVA